MSTPTPAALAIAELRAVTTALRLGGFDTLAASTITRTETGVVLSIPAGAAQPRSTLYDR